jgi:archaellum component FlaC
MPEPDWNLIGEQLDRMLREQAGLREENREIRAALGAVARKLDGFGDKVDSLADRIDAIADDVSLLKIEVRAVGDRLNGTAQ